MDDEGGIIVYPDSPSGVFIVNSGNFQTGTASLSYYDLGVDTVFNEIISYANNLWYWGDVAQSMIIRGGLGYVVVNNSGKILVIDTNTYRVVGKITGLVSPRHMHFINDEKAYVTDLYGRAISVVNPQAIFSSSDRETEPYAMIKVDNKASFHQHSTEKMVQWGDYVFVACWMRDNKILILDRNSDTVVDSLQVGAQPNSLVIDKYNKLWVLSDGGYDGNPYAYEEPSLTRIDLHTLNIEEVIVFPLANNPTELVINSSLDTLYYIDGDIYKYGVLSQEVPQLFITGNSEHTGYGKGFYALAIDPSSDDIYIADAVDNSQPGYVYRYTQAGNILDVFKVGVNPVGFCFK